MIVLKYYTNYANINVCYNRIGILFKMYKQYETLYTAIYYLRQLIFLDFEH